jgi:hypothetical protein
MANLLWNTSIRLVPASLAAIILGASLSLAQLSTTGTISGTVRDASGAVVPGASIVIVNEGTKVQRKTQSNSDGSFAVPGLTIGTYGVSVTKQGFETFTESGIILHPAQVATVNATMRVGQVTTQVQVTASAAQVQTSTPEVSSEVSEHQVVTLPLNGRNYQSLSALMPGVTNLNPDTALNQGGFLTSNVMSINGQGQSGTMYYLDGIWDMNTGNMTQTTVTPNPDTIQEVRVLQNNYGVQYSLMGANVVLLQTKSGTDTFHGGAFEYLRNDALDARNFFSSSVPPLKQNIFGYNVGGPVYIPHHYNVNKNKTFFFWSQQWVRQDIGSVLNGADPTTAMRNGVFPTTGPFATTLTNPVTGVPFPNNTIPTNMLSSSSLAFLNALEPLPNNPGGGFLNYQNLTPAINSQRDDQIKVDQNISSKLHLMAEYLDERQTNGNPNDTFLGDPFSTNANPVYTNNQLAQIQLTQTLSPSMVNTTSISMNNYVVSLAASGIYQTSQISAFHEVLPFKSGFGSNRLPQINMSQSWPGMGWSYNLPLNHASDLEDTLSDDWSWLRGSHYLQAGFQYVLGTKRQTAFADSNGQWNFTGKFTGNAMADFLLGDAQQFTQASTEGRPYVHYPIFSPYVQDRWNATRHLTFTLGMRFNYLPATHAQNGYITIFDPAKYNAADAPIVNANGTITATPTFNPENGLIFNGEGGFPPNFSSAHQYDWGPSAGFAWDVFGDGKTSLRGGFGMTYTRVPTGTDCSYFCGINYPRVVSLTLVNPSFPNPTGAAAAPASVQTIDSQDLNLYPAAQIQTYSLSLEHQFAGNWFASIAGAGDVAHHIGTYYDINQPLTDAPFDFNPLINTGNVLDQIYSPYLGYGSITTNVSPANSYWDALELDVTHPVGHGLFLSAAYTWEHSLSTERGTTFFENSNTMQDIHHPYDNYGNTNLNVPQILSLSGIWTLPWYRNATGLKGLVLGGWQYSDITTIQSGFSTDPGLSIPLQGLASRPDRATGAITGPKTVQEWFNTAAFAAPPAGYFGDAAPGSILGPGTVDFDMAFYKDFHIKEHQTIEFRGELFNIFNHTNFNGFSSTFGASNFGQITSAADPRIVEFALRYQF